MRIIYDGLPRQFIRVHYDRIQVWARARQPFDLAIEVEIPSAVLADRPLEPWTIRLKKTELVSRYGHETYTLVEALDAESFRLVHQWEAAQNEGDPDLDATGPL